jgi:hypothetical protein
MYHFCWYEYCSLGCDVLLGQYTEGETLQNTGWTKKHRKKYNKITFDGFVFRTALVSRDKQANITANSSTKVLSSLIKKHIVQESPQHLGQPTSKLHKRPLSRLCEPKRAPVM